MALHNMVFDGVTKTSKVIYFSPEEEAAELKRWVDNEEAQKNQPKVLTTEERMAALEAQVAKLAGGTNAVS